MNRLARRRPRRAGGNLFPEMTETSLPDALAALPPDEVPPFTPALTGTDTQPWQPASGRHAAPYSPAWLDRATVERVLNGLRAMPGSHPFTAPLPPDITATPPPAEAAHDLPSDLRELPVFRAAVGAALQARHGTACWCGHEYPREGTTAERFYSVWDHLHEKQPAVAEPAAGDMRGAWTDAVDAFWNVTEDARSDLESRSDAFDAAEKQARAARGTRRPRFTPAHATRPIPVVTETGMAS